MTGAWRDELAFAQQLADVADAITMGHFRKQPSTRHKADGTIVTEADEAVEAALREAINVAYPSHGIFGEEQPETSAAARGGPRWIIDPIDGTNSFAAGVPVWATLIAYEHDGEVVVGVASAPAIAERYSAARGSGSLLNGEPIAVSDEDDLAGARLAYTSIRSFVDERRADEFLALEAAVRWGRGFSDFWGHALVARGAVDVMAEPAINPWDIAALQVIVEEAGGRMTDLDGARGIGGASVLSTNGLLHDAAIGAFRRGATSGR